MEENQLQQKRLAYRIYKSCQSTITARQCPFCLQNIPPINVYLHVKNCLQIYEQIATSSSSSAVPSNNQANNNNQPSTISSSRIIIGQETKNQNNVVNTNSNSNGETQQQQQLSDKEFKEEWMEQKRIEFRKNNPNGIEPIGQWEMEYSIMFE